MTEERRKQFDVVMMNTAKEFASLSYARRKKVGAVLEKEGRILACGFNGTAPGDDNSCENSVDCPDCGGEGVYYTNEENIYNCPTCCDNGEVLETKEDVLHAEQNILTFCNRHGITTDGATMHITLSPCVTCAKLMNSSGIKRIVYDEEYRSREGLDYLERVGFVEVEPKDFRKWI